ncbi:hypothetical protein AB0K51_33860 [Kitasatospora sp. NPDC049285]|uniref:hypothetical protein n=1 Tax=Kitasatospora sp. NPDC049285 TaxID=3157096 RepID=UPI00344579DC
MPGQRKRKRRRQEARQEHAARYAEYRNGPWQVVFETQDYAEWPAHVHRLRAERRYDDESKLRLDVLCGRLVYPTTYRLSVLEPAEGERPAAAE